VGSNPAVPTQKHQFRPLSGAARVFRTRFRGASTLGHRPRIAHRSRVRWVGSTCNWRGRGSGFVAPRMATQTSTRGGSFQLWVWDRWWGYSPLGRTSLRFGATQMLCGNSASFVQPLVRYQAAHSSRWSMINRAHSGVRIIIQLLGFEWSQQPSEPSTSSLRKGTIA
jgi:hypothetical protein